MNAANIPMAVILCFCAAVFAVGGCWAAMGLSAAAGTPLGFSLMASLSSSEVRRW